jgi:hypothetical protein
MKKSLLALLVSVALAVPLVAATDNAAEKVNAETVGGFAVKLAAALGTPASNEQAAAASLRSAGVDLKANLSARLTEAEAARILSDLGMKVAAPTSPSNEVSSGKSTQLAAAAGLSLSASPGLELNGSELPVHCLLEKNVGQCVVCCKPELGYDPDLPRAGQITKFCTQFCKNTEPPCSSPPCDEEPQP